MKNKKHDHNWTNLLKVFIFALMILMPFIIFMPNAFYYGFNKHAVAQEKTFTDSIYYQTNDVNNINDLVVGRAYKLTIDSNVISTPFVIYISDYKTDNLITYRDATITNTRETPLIIRNTEGGVFLIKNNSNNNNAIAISEGVLPFVYNGYDLNLVDVIGKISSYSTFFKEYGDVTINMSITDSMSYAWKSTWQNDLFSWTRTTAIYNGINTTTNAIGITQESYLADYLTYIILFTIIYVIIDIILSAFTMLTHIFNKEPK